MERAPGTARWRAIALIWPPPPLALRRGKTSRIGACVRLREVFFAYDVKSLALLSLLYYIIDVGSMNNGAAEMTRDYSVKMKDRSGRECELHINGASIDDLVAWGMSASQAKEEVESNAFGRAIDNGEIGDDAWIE